MTRDDALKSLDGSPYPTPEELAQDTVYFIKKMGWTEAQLADYLQRPEKAHDSYPSEKGLYTFCAKIYKMLKR